MSKPITSDAKAAKIAIMCKSFSKEQVKHLEGIEKIDARYKCAQRYMRQLNEGNKGLRIKAMELYERYKDILEGLECIDEGLWTDEEKIRTFSNLLDGYCDKCVKLVDVNNRKHLERLKMQRDQQRIEYEQQQERYDKEIAELEERLR